MLVNCHSCGRANELSGPVGRRDSCVHCDAELRCCLQCKFFDPQSASECREIQAEVPRDKSQANFCELFAVGDGIRHHRDEVSAAKAAFDALFKRA